VASLDNCRELTAASRQLKGSTVIVRIELLLLQQLFSASSVDRPVVIAGSGRCGSTLLQSIVNTNPDFLIWGEHNGFLSQIAAAFYDAAHERFPDESRLDGPDRIKRLRDPRRWPAWDNLHGDAAFLEQFRVFIRSFFADPTGRATRWGFKEIRYALKDDDRALRLMFDCFPEMRLIILIRDPEPTIFSALSHWVFADTRNGIVDLEELDRVILAAAAGWNAQYMRLQSLHKEHASNCLAIRYEDLGSSETYQGLAGFLETASFNFQGPVDKVKDASNKTDPTARLIRQRIELLQPQIAIVTREAQAAYGYSIRRGTLNFP
jgi:hypothetical protein